MDNNLRRPETRHLSELYGKISEINDELSLAEKNSRKKDYCDKDTKDTVRHLKLQVELLRKEFDATTRYLNSSLESVDGRLGKLSNRFSYREGFLTALATVVIFFLSVLGVLFTIWNPFS